LLLAHYFWAVRSDVAFEEASLSLAQKRAEIADSVRAGNWHSAASKKTKKRPPFVLQPVGSPAVAHLWKNLLSAGQVFNLRTLFLVAFFALCVGGPIGASLRGNGRWAPPIGIVTATLGAYS